MSFDRASFSGGAAYLIWNGLSILMETDWEVEDSTVNFPVNTNLRNVVAEGVQDVMSKIRFTPIAISGSLEDLQNALVPYANKKKGDLIFPSEDLPAVIQTTSGKAITYSAAAVTQLPTITFAPHKTYFGQMELTCLVANNTSLATANSFVNVTTSAYEEPAFDPLDVLFDLYTFAWGSTPPFDAIEVDDKGIVFKPKIDLVPRKRGPLTYNMQIDGVSAELEFSPQNLTEAQYYASLMRMDGTGLQVGKLRSQLGQAVTIAGSAAGKAKLTVPLMYADKGGMKFDKDDRFKPITLKAAYKVDEGAFQPLWNLGLVP